MPDNPLVGALRRAADRPCVHTGIFVGSCPVCASDAAQLRALAEKLEEVPVRVLRVLAAQTDAATAAVLRVLAGGDA